MRPFNIINFHNLKIQNAKISTKPFEKTTFTTQDAFTVIFIQNPFIYFDSLLEYHILYNMSPKLAKETKTMLSKKSHTNFLLWLKELNYLPLINPQTFQLDMKKRVDKAIDTLSSFDYIVPCEFIDIFIKNVAPELMIEKPLKTIFPFSLSQIDNLELIEHFIGKDQKLFKQAHLLWQQIEINHFTSLKTLNIPKKQKKSSKYIGIVDTISSNMISGWVFRENNDESILVGIYQNGILRHETKANIFRPGVKKNLGHPTGYCGFKAKFKNNLFQSSDKIEIKILPEEIPIKLGKKALKFQTP